MYACAECGTEVTVVNSFIERNCDCTGPIIAEVTAHASGVGGMR